MSLDHAPSESYSKGHYQVVWKLLLLLSLQHLPKTGRTIQNFSSGRRYGSFPRQHIFRFFMFVMVFVCYDHTVDLSFSVSKFQIKMLSKINHKNFVNLLGFCEENEPFTRILIFEYAPNGSLFEHLHCKHRLAVYSLS